MFAGDIAEARVHFDQAISLYNPAAHRQLAMRFGEDQTIASLSLRSWALCLLGYLEAALRDADDALKQARETGQATSRRLSTTLRANAWRWCRTLRCLD